MSGYIATEIVSVDLLDVLSGSENGAPERGSLVGQGVEVIKYYFLYLLLNFLV